MASAKKETTKAQQPAGKVGKPHDLPGGLSAPARRALAGAGISTLDDVTQFTRQQILDLHGVGPNTIEPLENALAERGLSFAEG